MYLAPPSRPPALRENTGAAGRTQGMHARLAALEFQVFAVVGHWVFRQAPAQAVALLRAFLSHDLRESCG